MLRFQGMTESIAPMCSTFLANLARRTAFRSGPDQVIKRAGSKHAYPSSRRVPAGYSSIGLVATRARLRFADKGIIKRWTIGPKGIIIEPQGVG